MTVPSVLNPYVVGGAIGGHSGRGFVGREDVFKFVISALMVERRAAILLHGQRRMGKSSILKQIPRHLPGEFSCVYFDLQGTASMKTEQLLYGLALEISEKLGIDPPEREACVEDRFPDFVKHAVQSLGGHEERLVLVFDEFDVIDQPVKGTEVAASRFIPYLARLIEQFPGVGYILAVGRKMEELSPEFFSTLLKETITKQIKRLTESQVKGLARDLAAKYLEFDDASLDRIYFLTDGHPFCAQALCNVIWKVATGEHPSFPAEVTLETVNRALPEALELWSNGLNWVYDGMSRPAHRLVLSALAEAVDPLAGGTASLDRINATLRPTHMTLDQLDFSIAVRELVEWDILIRSSSGLAFSVPMIGAWIAKNRALETLRGEAALLNPRAQRYYELAIESLNQDNFDGAIGDFHNALAASPDSLDSLRGLSRALSLRREPHDFRSAAETYERLLELDPTEPRAALIEILADWIDAGGPAEEISSAFGRLKELAVEGPYVTRATRRLADAARSHEVIGSGDNLKIARFLYSALGDRASAQRVQRSLSWRARGRLLALAIGAAFFLLSGLGSTLIELSNLKGLFGALSGAFLGYGLDNGARRTRRSRLIAAMFVVGMFGGSGYFFTWNSVAWTLVGFIVGALFYGFSSFAFDSPSSKTGISLS